MPFAKGNKAAANRTQKSWRDVVAQLIRKTLEQEGDKLTNAQFVTLVNRLAMLKVTKGPRRPRVKKDPLHAMVLELNRQQKEQKSSAFCVPLQN